MLNSSLMPSLKAKREEIVVPCTQNVKKLWSLVLREETNSQERPFMSLLDKFYCNPF